MTDDCATDFEYVTYSSGIGAYVTTFDTSPSVAIIEALEDITNQNMPDVEPFHKVTGIDADALDDLFRSPQADGPRQARVEFTYESYTIRVFSYGRIEIEPVDDPDK